MATVCRHALDLPNMLGHALLCHLKDIRDTENWNMEGWNNN